MATDLLSPPPVLAPSETENEPSTSRKKPIPGFDAREIYDPQGLSWKRMNWTIVVWLVVLHAGLLLAPFYFTWSALAVALGLQWLTGSIGVCLGYHRFLAHRSLKLVRPVEFFVMLCGVLSGEGSPLFWAATHRLHHKLSDKEGDPHSPLDGPFWSHLLWLFTPLRREESKRLYDRFVPDLQKRPMMWFFEYTAGLWIVALGVALYAIGGLPWLIWGMVVRQVVVYHGTWFVNSATHIWGYRNYETSDESKNLWWVAVLSFGEGWHNNHHAHPSVAPAGHRWWELDTTWWVIKALRFTGLAYKVNDRIPQPTPAKAEPVRDETLHRSNAA